MLLELLFADLRQALRNALRHPAFTALVVMTVALGIGINSAVFALVDGVLLRPLPYRDPAALVFVWQTLPSHQVYELEPTPFDYAAWHQVASFETVAMVLTDAFTIADPEGDGQPERVRGARITASLLPMLGIAPQSGRAFTSAEDDDAAPAVAILGEGLWRRRFAADSHAIGRGIRINGTIHTIVGVMPPTARLPGHLAGNSDLWLPARMSAAERADAIRHDYTVLARLAPGVSIAAASREIGAFAQRMAAEHPDSHANVGARLTLVQEVTVRGIRPALLVISIGVALLLLVACANAATLLVARAAARRHEGAIRTALGATRQRLLATAMVEGALYASLGGVAGLILGSWMLNALVPLFVGSLPPSAVVGISVRVALFTAGLSVLLAAAFGIVVSAHQPRQLTDALKASSRTTTGGTSVIRTRSTLVVAQVALAVVLLGTAGLMLNSVEKLSRVDPGFGADHVLSFRLSLTGGAFEAPSRRSAFARELIDRLRALPGVATAGLTSQIPFGGTRGANGVEIEGRPPVRGATLIVDQRHVTPDYFRTMQIPLLEGRGLAATDDERAEPVVVVNRAMARKYWPNDSAINRRVQVTAGFDGGHWLRIVGVVGDVRHISLTREVVPEMYRPYAQAAVPGFTVVVRTAGDAAAVAALARDAVHAVDPSMPLFDVRPMSERVASSFAQTRATMLLLVVIATLAAALAAVAIYGSVWYSVSQRMAEIGIRLALGASRGAVFSSVIGRALALTAIGAASGTLVTIAAGPVLKSFLFETRTTDPLTFAVVIAGVLGLTAVAGAVPAHRAMRVDPLSALRSD